MPSTWGEPRKITNEKRSLFGSLRSRSVQSLIDTNGFSILPCNEFSIKTVNGHYAPSLLLLNPIPQTTPDLPIMDSLFHRLWLVFLWRLVNISARCLSSLHSPLCCIDLFVHPPYIPPLWWEDDLLWNLIPFKELIFFFFSSKWLGIQYVLGLIGVVRGGDVIYQALSSD